MKDDDDDCQRRILGWRITILWFRVSGCHALPDSTIPFTRMYLMCYLGVLICPQRVLRKSCRGSCSAELGTVDSIFGLRRPPSYRTQLSDWTAMFHCSCELPEFPCVTVSHHACRPYFGNSLDQLLNSDVVSNPLSGTRSPQPSRTIREAILQSHGFERAS